jgi:non-heme chloroperoxidase
MKPMISRLTRHAGSLTLTLVALLALASSLGDADAQSRACGSDVRPIEVNQTTLHYFECGNGEPLVFVHGATGDLHTFRRQAETFATHFQVVAYSRRYSPPNSPPRVGDKSSPLPMHVADLAALLTTLKATPAHLVGHSSGALIALALAVEQPTLVRSLVLGEPPVLPLLSSTSVGEAIRESGLRRVRATAKALEGGDIEEALRRFFEVPCGGPCFDGFPQSRRTELVEKHGPAVPSEVQMLMDMSVPQPTLACEKLRELKRPTLLVTGERSPAVFLLITAELERCLEGTSQVMVPEAGHGMHGDNPDFYNTAVMGFLQRSREPRK